MSENVQPPSRLHHNAYVTRDMEATRKFYEDLVGMPLIATWAEKTDLFGKERVYCHCFFALENGGALAFFQFATEEDHHEFGPQMPPSPFPSHRTEGDPGTTGRHTRADPGRRLQGARGVLRPGARLLPFSLHIRPQRTDRGIYRRPPRCRTNQCRPASGRTPDAGSLARRRPLAKQSGIPSPGLGEPIVDRDDDHG